ncbi:uncharacterized protein BHQ10_005342 [Talaromyces amestolkiae]|uniref:DUF4470 domain-containing protein n=1 Tax=Talaromyces amestolkiae TaxID=1196081 RepID=A0A364L0K4_TALAM|nr:uncharacterized protein BHQ10_005342 [Talaromyces amestolkiae]RAO69330.1 hypothetical protein BHQ10_005342 [Talaromyces amestolkiae]
MQATYRMKGVNERERGNALYKRGHLTEAIKAYQEAARRAEPDDYLPWSNLSAAYYEVGSFHESIQCAQRALAICQHHGHENGISSTTIELKILPRIFRGYLHTHQYDAARQWLHRLADIQSPSSVDDLRQYEAALDHAESVWQAFPDEEAYGLRLLAELPRSQPALLQTNGRPESSKNVNLDHVTALVDFTVHFNVDRDFSVFLGGIGDARHFYAQLAILGVTERMVMHSTSPLKRKYRFTLNDRNSVAIARNLVLLVLLDELACLTEISQAERTEIYTTIYFIFAGVIMPRYASDRFINTVDSIVGRLRNNEPILPWLQIHDSDNLRLIGALESWLDIEPNNRLSTSNVLDGTVQSLHDTRMSNKSGCDFDSIPKAPPGCQKEFETYFNLPLLQAPRSVMREHEPELLQLIEMNAPLENIRTYVAGNWCVNPTPVVTGQTNGSNPFDVCRALYNIVSMQERGGPKKTKLFDYASSFFQMVVVALRKIRGRLSAEYVLNDALVAIDGIRCNLEQDRNSAIPAGYDLIHLFGSCDVPTVISASKILNESQAARLMISARNSDFDLGERDSFATNDSVTLHKVTQMQMIPKKSQYGSSHPLSNEYLLEMRRERLAPFPYEHLLSRAELSRFLFSEFYSLAWPFRGNSTSASAGLTYFFDLLIHLHSIGYPAHWIADALAKILGDGINASPSPPRTPDEATPRNHLCTSAAIRGAHGSIAPFLAETSTLASMFQRLLPFNPIVTLPPLNTIYQYGIGFKPDNAYLPQKPMALMIYNPDAYIPMTSLSFPEEGCIIISIFTYTYSGNGYARIDFWMREDIMTQLQSSSNETWHCDIFRATDPSHHNSDDEVWKPYIEQSVSIDSIVKGEQWISAPSFFTHDGGVDADEAMALDA